MVKRFMMVSRDCEHWDLEEAGLGEWVRWTDVQPWFTALELIDARIRGSVASDPLFIHDIVKTALSLTQVAQVV
jgi:hypothetical protein